MRYVSCDFGYLCNMFSDCAITSFIFFGFSTAKSASAKPGKCVCSVRHYTTVQVFEINCLELRMDTTGHLIHSV